MSTRRWKVACINWSHPDAPKALAYLAVSEDGMRHARYFPTWAEAIAAVTR